MCRLSREWARWVVGAWRGSSARKVEELSGVEDLQRVMTKKRIRWAASVYGRYIPALRPVAEQILDELLQSQNVTWEWLTKPLSLEKRKEIKEVE